jgi:hypothetical protein
MNHHSLGIRPGVNELADLAGVILGEKNVGRLAALGQVVEVQSKYCRETRRDAGRESIGVRD